MLCVGWQDIDTVTIRRHLGPMGTYYGVSLVRAISG
jgi:hypothetical protein